MLTGNKILISFPLRILLCKPLYTHRSKSGVHLLPPLKICQPTTVKRLDASTKLIGAGY